MRWIALAILTYLLVLLQTSLIDVVAFHVPEIGLVRPELLAIVVVFCALHVRSALDAMLAGWGLGLTLDLTTGAGSVMSTAVGPMSLAYALAAGVVYKVRGAVFREKAVTQCVMTMVFCIMAHWLWITMQWTLAFRGMTVAGFALMLVQAAMLSVYTAAIAPVGHVGLRACRRWLLVGPAGRMDRRR